MSERWSVVGEGANESLDEEHPVGDKALSSRWQPFLPFLPK